MYILEYFEDFLYLVSFYFVSLEILLFIVVHALQDELQSTPAVYYQVKQCSICPLSPWHINYDDEVTL